MEPSFDAGVVVVAVAVSTTVDTQRYRSSGALIPALE